MNQQKPNPRNALITIWNALVLTSEVVASLLIVGMGVGALFASGCAPVEPDGRGGIRTECGPDGGPTSNTVCAEGQYALCINLDDGGTRFYAVCCNLEVSAEDCERSARRDH